MLESLEIRDFQRHRHLKIDFDPEVTTVCGETETGKSSLLRALRWLATNRPDGDRFIHWGQGEASVRLCVDDHVVERRRGKGENAYLLDGDKFVAFKRFEVPEMIARFLNLGEENFQSQFADPFWLTKTGGEASRELNRIVNLDLIDHVLENLAGALRQARAAVSVSQERLQAAEAKKEALSWVGQAEGKLKEIEELEEERATIEHNCFQIEFLYEKAVRMARKKKTLSWTILARVKAISLTKKLEEVIKERDRIESLVDRAHSLEEKQCQLGRKIRQREREIRQALKHGCPLCGRKDGPLLPLSVPIST